VRLASAFDMKVHTFCARAFPGSAFWNRDVDRFASEAVLAALAEHSVTPLARVHETTLAALAGTLFEFKARSGVARWVLPAGIYHRTRLRHGLLFCSACLAEDRVPYMRRQWRLAWAVVCTRHDAPLRDRCPACAAPVVHFRGELGQRWKCEAEPMSVCHRCGADLAASATMDRGVADPDLCALQLTLERTVRHGWAFVPSHGPVPALAYFAGLRQLCRLLGSRRVGARLRAATAEYYALPVPAVEPALGDVERMTLVERTDILRLALLLAHDWPAGLVSICNEMRVWASTLLRDFDSAPFWYWKAVHENLDRSSYEPSVEEIAWCIAKNDEVFGGRYRPPDRRIRFRSISNASGTTVTAYGSGGMQPYGNREPPPC